MSLQPAALIRPRFRSAPPAGSTDADRCIDLAAVAGLDLYPWQQDVIRAALGIDPSGRWAARIAALICPRQNGKGGVLEALELFWLFLCPDDRLIIHTAHRFDTSQDHFLRIRALVENSPTLMRRVRSIRVANGSEGIVTKDGSRLLFKARSKGGIRGLSPDKIVLDEAYYLWDEALSAILPAMAARPNPQVWYTSSSPIPGAESDVLRRLCKRGRAGDPSMAYIEYSCEVGVDLDDEDLWFDANPSLGGGLGIETLRSNRATMTDEAFGAEHLGIWSENEADGGVIDLDAWNTNTIDVADASWLADPVCFGVEGNASGDCFTVVAAVHTGERVGLDVVRHDYGTGWLLDWAIGVNERQSPKAWVFDPKSSTADLFMADFIAAGLPVIECGYTDRNLPRATAGLFDDITNKRIEHLNHPALDAAVAGARWRFVGESRLWDRKAGVAIAPLVAATLARFGLLEQPEPAPVPFAAYT